MKSVALPVPEIIAGT